MAYFKTDSKINIGKHFPAFVLFLRTPTHFFQKGRVCLQKTKNPDFTEGPLFVRIFMFAVPLILTGILQLLYNAADNIVVGKFSGDPNALAAVGCTGSLNNLIVTFLISFSVGSSVVIAQNFGAKKEDAVSKAVHTSISIALIGGIVISVLGFFLCERVLIMMGTNPELLPKAKLYTQIICIGIPASAVYNFGATVFRAIGDSKTPLIILACTGIVNVVFNLIFVIVFNLSVAGVAIATIISQYLSAFVVIFLLYRSNECYCFRFRKLGFSMSILEKMLIIGIPAGIQGILFSISNVIIQSGVNTFPIEVISGNTIGATIEGFTYISMNSFSHATITFAGQNFGAFKFDRVKKVLFYALLQVTAVGIFVGYMEILFARPLSALFVDTTQQNIPLVIDAAAVRIKVILGTYFLCGVMEVLAGYLRALGRSFTTMICSLTGACLLRIVWVKFIFVLPAFNSQTGLYISYPITWLFTCLLLAAFALFTSIKLFRRAKKLNIPEV